MGRKIRAAKASLVAAFVAAGGATAATANARPAAPPSQAVATINWGDQLVRFLKLDGLPSYLKIDGFAQYYKEISTPDALQELTAFYDKWRPQVDDVLAVYQKDRADLEGILIGLEQYYKEKNIEPLLSFLKEKDAQAAYIKFETFLGFLKIDAPNAFDFFQKETSIAGDPLRQIGTDGGGDVIS
jgi:hypothetical protein